MHGTNVERLAALADKLGNNVSVVTADLSDRQAVTDIVPQVVEAAGAVDILVNNAGITQDNLFMRLKDEEWDRVSKSI